MTKEEYKNIVDTIIQISELLNKLSKEAFETIPPFEPPYTIKEE